ncbi:MAG: hypothetical protein M3443_09680 [Actinomycetota bacterium]|nr:hypothetical protein [Actinomycetota bacterium]
MSSLGERLDNITLRVHVPGTEIRAELRDRKNIGISFGPDVYQWLSERHLEHYLATLARLLYVGWNREYHAALSDSFVGADAPQNPRDREFLDARDELESQGASGDGRITVSAVGMQNVEVRIATGTLRALSEQDFVARVKEAVNAFLEDYLTKIRGLKVRFFA